MSGILCTQDKFLLSVHYSKDESLTEPKMYFHRSRKNATFFQILYTKVNSKWYFIDKKISHLGKFFYTIKARKIYYLRSESHLWIVHIRFHGCGMAWNHEFTRLFPSTTHTRYESKTLVTFFLVFIVNCKFLKFRYIFNNIFWEFFPSFVILCFEGNICSTFFISYREFCI